MKIGIVVAMEKELQPLLDMAGEYQVRTISGQKVYSFSKYENVTVILSGVGEIRACIATMTLFHVFHVEKIVNYGYVGSLDENLKIGDLVVIDSVYHVDVDLTLFGNKPGQYEDREEVDFATDTATFQTYKFKRKHLLSGDEFLDAKEADARLSATFGRHVMDMEGAGIAVACKMADIPVTMLKCVSNSVNDGVEAYKEFSLYGIRQCVNCVFETIFKGEA